jgi:hypothetical protein
MRGELYTPATVGKVPSDVVQGQVAPAVIEGKAKPGTAANDTQAAADGIPPVHQGDSFFARARAARQAKRSNGPASPFFSASGAGGSSGISRMA